MRTLLPILVLSAALLPACEAVDCTPTTTAAADASKIDLVAPPGSAVLTARLTAEARGLAGKEIRFDVLADGSSVYSGTAASGGDGTAALDLKQVDAGSLAAVVRGDSFRASFSGDATYCSSSDDAPFDIVRAPAGLPVG